MILYTDGLIESTRDLFEFIQSTMPPTGDTLSAEQYLAVTAFILQQNGYPAGNTPLTVNAVTLPAAPFVATPAVGPGSVLSPGGHVVQPVAFDPTTAGSFASQFTATGVFTQTGGTTTLVAGGALASSAVVAGNGPAVVIQTGALQGTGAVTGNTANSGTVSPGAGTAAGRKAHCLRQLEQVFGLFRIALGEHRVAGFVINVVLQRQSRRTGVQLERVPAESGEGGIVPEQRPVAGIDGRLLLIHAEGHIVAVGNAVRVGDDQRRPVPLLCFEKGLPRPEVATA